MPRTARLDLPQTLILVVAIAVCAIVGINALAFTATNAIPLPVADTWFFIESFVRPALEGNLRIADFFVQREAGDHSQPLQKLLLLADVRWGDMDFRNQAVVGVALGVLTCSGLAWLMARGAGTPRERTLAALGAVAIFVGGLSLNATNVYTWYLVALIWVSLILSFAYWYLLGRRRETWQTAIWALVSTFVLAIFLDELALPAFAALVGALLVRDGVRNPRPTLVTLLAGTAAIVVARYLLGLTASAPGTADATGGSVAALAGVLSSPDAWKLVVGPLADSVVHQVHLQALPPGRAQIVQILIAALLLAGHACFWWRAMRGPRPRDAILIVAVSAMLFFYAGIAGIALSRIPEFGMEYIHQPRYVVIYQLNLLAMALLFFAPVRSSDQSTHASGAMAWVAGAMAVALLGLQVPLASRAWKDAEYLRTYVRNATTTLFELGRNPATTPPACPPILVVCRSPPQRRMETMGLLKAYRLNLYSPEFQKAHRIEGMDENGSPAAIVEQATPICDGVKVLAWGPKEITGSKPFNQQPDGRSAHWLKVHPDAARFPAQVPGTCASYAPAGRCCDLHPFGRHGRGNLGTNPAQVRTGLRWSRRRPFRSRHGAKGKIAARRLEQSVEDGMQRPVRCADQHPDISPGRLALQVIVEGVSRTPFGKVRRLPDEEQGGLSFRDGLIDPFS